MLVQLPDMPWSRDRYIDGHWDKAMSEVAMHVKALRSQGASKVVEARTLVVAGKGDSRERFNDINQGKQLTVVATAKDYLSYFDPESDAEMGMTAARIPTGTPVLTAVGDDDYMFTRARAYFVDKLPAHPKSQYLEVKANH